jgi:hypothetical protein
VIGMIAVSSAQTKILRKHMKSKALILISTLLMALALIAQSTQSTPAPSDNTAKSCASCNHAQADGKTSCCGKDSSCCKGGSCGQGKDGKACAMMSKDSSGKMQCCAGGKCAMAPDKEGKGCCGGKMCARPQSGV